jgi:RNA polymerase sigma-70 factor, ECF subfamily
VSDRAAFESVFRAHVGAVHAYALRRSDAATADEVVADTFLVCWRRFDRVPEDALPWLYAVARRCLANRLRAGRRTQVRSTPPPSASGDQTVDTYEQRARAREVLAALAELPPKEREALQLCAWEGSLRPRPHAWSAAPPRRSASGSIGRGAGWPRRSTRRPRAT